MTKIYLAGRYSRRLELLGYVKQLEWVGHEVTSRWLHGEHELRDNGIVNVYPEEQKSKFAAEDIADVRAADMVISFTEPEGTQFAGRGGRHVEFGLALALDKSLVVVGFRENVFHSLHEVAYYPTWEECFKKHFGGLTDEKDVIIRSLKSQINILQVQMDNEVNSLRNDASLGRKIRNMPLRSTLTRQVNGGYRYKTHDAETGELTGEFGTYREPEDALSTIE